MKMLDYKTHTLSNGIRIIHQQVSSHVAHCGIIINTGTRDETEDEHGIAHFIEHVIFKGTIKRKPYHILSRIDDVGGEIDAYTSKENTVVSATFLYNYYERSIELISDILFNSTFPEKEIEKEKVVIFDEINSYKDNPSELIYDDFEEQVFRDHPLGRNILGSRKNLKKINKVHIERFIKANYNTDQMVICSVGNISFNKLLRVIQKHFGAVPANPRTYERTTPTVYIPEYNILKKKTFQAHCMIGCKTYDVYDNRRIILELLNNILGGPGLNSRLNLVLREKYGLVYNIEASYVPYSDTGVSVIYFGTEKENLDKSISLVTKELERVRTTRLGTLQLSKAKRQLIGQVAVSADSNANLMYTLGKSYLLFNKVENLDEVSKRINEITASDILEIANEAYAESNLTTLIYK